MLTNICSTYQEGGTPEVELDYFTLFLLFLMPQLDSFDINLSSHLIHNQLLCPAILFNNNMLIFAALNTQG